MERKKALISKLMIFRNLLLLLGKVNSFLSRGVLWTRGTYFMEINMGKVHGMD